MSKNEKNLGYEVPNLEKGVLVEELVASIY